MGVCFAFDKKYDFSTYIQNNIGNKYSPTVVVAAITSKAATKAKLPTHIALDVVNGLDSRTV